jgi:hypothetical protein
LQGSIDHLHDEALLRARQTLNALDLLQEPGLGCECAPNNDPTSQVG